MNCSRRKVAPTVNSLNEIAVAVSAVKRALICGHVMPDGDSLGSAFALAAALRVLGKDVIVAGPDPVPVVYSFLPGTDGFHAGSPPADDFDTMITVDCPVAFRLGLEYQDLPGKIPTVINIDHHTSTNSFGTYRYIDPSAAAVGEIVYDLLRLMQINIDIDIAICLYTAIVTDTGSFQYENTTADTHKRMIGLLETGAPLHLANTKIYEEKPLPAQLLLKEALKTLSVSRDGKVAWMRITRATLRDAGAKDENTEGIVNYARSIRGVEVGILFHEQAGGKIKIGFRSKEKVNVAYLAGMFGGGGHKRAAGCEIPGDMDTVVENVLGKVLPVAGDGLD